MKHIGKVASLLRLRTLWLYWKTQALCSIDINGLTRSELITKASMSDVSTMSSEVKQSKHGNGMRNGTVRYLRLLNGNKRN